MQWSSESIARLASALAKAQIELVNPEKSLVGTIYPEAGTQEGRSFNYASLASGLEIVRTTLGQHEIAVVQTTAIDHGAGIVNLTTVLAHASGEWIASDWPVCAISETVTPHRMGASLTYARRYALFTLVGIAGEDDLDAPDLPTTPTSQKAPTRQVSTPQTSKGIGNGHLNDRWGSFHRNGTAPSRLANPILRPDESAALRDRLLVELSELGSADDAALWAYRCLPEKNKLTKEDAQRVEEAFQLKLAPFAIPTEDVVEEPWQNEQPASVRGTRPDGPQKRRHAKGIDKSALALREPRRIRDGDHVKFVARQPCMICGRTPSDAHHLRFTQWRALGRKVSDEFTVPLCRGHHRELHRCGDEAAWWKMAGIDALASARALWLKTHPLPAPSRKISIEGGNAAAGADQKQRLA
jgi:hypothetical protein